MLQGKGNVSEKQGWRKVGAYTWDRWNKNFLELPISNNSHASNR